jgi:hypothetical protein
MDPDIAFQANIDPDPIRIQFDDQQFFFDQN